MKAKDLFRALNRPKLVDEVVKQLQRKFSDGEMHSGQKIPTEPKLMEQFGVGRSTIREAVRVLVHSGLLEKKQGFGTYLIARPVIQEPLLHRLRRAEILEVYEVRRMLELEISGLAALRREDKDIAQMRSALDQCVLALHAGDMRTYLNADIAFHLSVAVASKNSIAADLFRSFSSVILDANTMLYKNQSFHQSQHFFHENLYQAIKDKNVGEALKWTLKNLNETIDQQK
ncbi:FadR/GntR family transcriptional regulator [Paenibacillus sepulcri]|uniref:FCD domain-containing protein n=1 Tax=Paenibacillus sepulcri TaxID=359917 RepID=A0ABS7BW28_9BACL|nr:FCD domain-containing protein [Paenibacillus sepulcri]